MVAFNAIVADTFSDEINVEGLLKLTVEGGFNNSLNLNWLMLN